MTGVSISVKAPLWCMHMRKTNLVSIYKLMRSLSPQNSETGFLGKEKKYCWFWFSVFSSPGVELKDQEISQEAKQRFELLKKIYPEVFSLNSQDIGNTNLVTMHVVTGDSPPICQKPYTLPLKHYSWVQKEIKTLEHGGVIRKSISS